MAKNYDLKQLRGAWAAGKNSSQSHSFVGKWFLSMKDGKVNWQGHVVSEPTKDKFLVQLFSWIDGRPTDQLIVNLHEMMDWQFYNSSEKMIDGYERWQRIHSTS